MLCSAEQKRVTRRTRLPRRNVGVGAQGRAAQRCEVETWVKGQVNAEDNGQCYTTGQIGGIRSQEVAGDGLHEVFRVSSIIALIEPCLQ